MRTPISGAVRRKIMVLITMDTHNRDIDDLLVREDVSDKNNFLWSSQLRPKFLAGLDCFLKYISIRKSSDLKSVANSAIAPVCLFMAAP